MLIKEYPKHFPKLSIHIIVFITFIITLLYLSIGVSDAANNANLIQTADIAMKNPPQSSSAQNIYESRKLVGAIITREGVGKSGIQFAAGDFSLHTAAKNNDWDTIQNLLVQGADINVLNNQLQTPLMTAINFGHDDLAMRLVRAGADVNLNTSVTSNRTPNSSILGPRMGSRGKITRFSRSPLGVAGLVKNETIALFLYKEGAMLNDMEKGGYGKHPTMKFALSNNFYIFADTVLDIMAREQKKETLNDLMPWCANLKESKPQIDYLLDHGVSLESFDKEGRTPLMLAAMRGDLDMVIYLLNHGANIDTPNNPAKGYSQFKGYTALMLAASRIRFSHSDKSPQVPVVRYLLKGGADVNHQGRDKKTTLHLLSSRNTPLELIDIAFEYGARPNIQDALGYTPFKWALYGRKFKRVDIAELLIEKGADINIGINISGYIQSDPAVVDFLLETHYDLNLERKDRFGRNLTTPLINVCAKGKTEYVMKFIAAGADVNLASSSGNTPLLSAIASGKLEIVKILVDSGADVNQQSKRGATPFLVASANGQKEIADYLKSKGADTKGWTTDPITLALLKKAGLVPDDADGISKENLKLLLAMLKEEYGISSLEKLNKPDPRFSSPEKTWQIYKKALIDGDLELAALCHIPRNHYIEFYRKTGPEKTKELAENFRPIEKISGDNKRIKYRIKRLQSGKDITYYIYFTNVFGEWKIEQF